MYKPGDYVVVNEYVINPYRYKSKNTCLILGILDHGGDNSFFIVQASDYDGGFYIDHNIQEAWANDRRYTLIQPMLEEYYKFRYVWLKNNEILPAQMRNIVLPDESIVQTRTIPNIGYKFSLQNRKVEIVEMSEDKETIWVEYA